MSDAVWAAIIGGAAGLGTGVIGSIIAPWSQWGIEKRRMKREDRKAAVALWRNGLAEWEVSTRESISNQTRPPLVSDLEWFGSLRRHLVADQQKAIDAQELADNRLASNWATEQAKRQIVDGDHRQPVARIIQAEIDRIEENWDLN